LTKLKNLPKINTLEKKLSFYLMKKEIQSTTHQQIL